jgi:[ribosomal protein S5]-alanine N-acetyltransferase
MFAEQPNCTIPTLTTNRLILRPFIFDDLARIVELLSEKAISETSPTIPYPYDERIAFEWMINQAAYCSTGQFYAFAVTLKNTKELVGSVSVTIRPDKQAEIGFWIGKPYWKKGICSEAAARVIEYMFTELKLEAVYAECMHNNAASSNVLKNLRMEFEKTVTPHIYRINKDLELDRYVVTNPATPA